MRQRVKREVANNGKNGGSRAGEHEQPNAGRKRKRRVFVILRFVGRTLSHARKQSATRHARTRENRKRKASLEATRTSPDDPKSRPRRSKMRLGARSDNQRPSQAVPGRSGDAPEAAHDAPGWLRRRAGGVLGGANRIRGASGERTGRRPRRADTKIVRSCRATCLAKRAGDVFSSAAAFRTNRPTCVSTQF